MSQPQNLPPVTPAPGTPCQYALMCDRDAVVLRDMGMAVVEVSGGATPMCQRCSDTYDRLSR